MSCTRSNSNSPLHNEAAEANVFVGADAVQQSRNCLDVKKRTMQNAQHISSPTNATSNTVDLASNRTYGSRMTNPPTPDRVHHADPVALYVERLVPRSSNIADLSSRRYDARSDERSSQLLANVRQTLNCERSSDESDCSNRNLYTNRTLAHPLEETGNDNDYVECIEYKVNRTQAKQTDYDEKLDKLRDERVGLVNRLKEFVLCNGCLHEELEMLKRMLAEKEKDLEGLEKLKLEKHQLECELKLLKLKITDGNPGLNETKQPFQTTSTCISGGR